MLKYAMGEKVKTQNMDGKYNGVSGIIADVFKDIDVIPVYMVKYDMPFGSCIQGMFRECDLITNEKEEQTK